MNVEDVLHYNDIFKRKNTFNGRKHLLESAPILFPRKLHMNLKLEFQTFLYFHAC